MQKEHEEHVRWRSGHGGAKRVLVDEEWQRWVARWRLRDVEMDG